MRERKRKRSVKDAPENNNQENYRKRRTNGLCARNGCEGEPVEGKSMCEEHLRQMRDRANTRYKERKAKGICPFCGAPAEGGVRCNDCKHAMLDSQRRIQARRKERNECRYCGKARTRRDVMHSTAYCMDCLFAQRSKNRKRTRKKRART